VTLRDDKKEIFLQVLSETNNIRAACMHADICRRTARNWVRSGYVTNAELETAKNTYYENIRLRLTVVEIKKKLGQICVITDKS